MEITYLSLLLAGLITGFSKFSVGGMGMLILPILMLSFTGHEALGIILPIYILTDIMAIATYRKQVQWRIILQIIPVAFLGMGVGFSLLTIVSNEGFAALVGLIILAMVALGMYLDKLKSAFIETTIAQHSFSLISGIVGMLANAAGPVISLFLVQKKLPKEAIIHTRVWTIFIINLAKIPTLFALGVLNIESVKLSLQSLPGLIIGIVAGYVFLKYINLAHLKWLIRTVAILAALKLLFS
ncbi:MAG: sulfite exporter TauE/SafE family protein [Cellvibrionaceae bacterium]